MAGDDTAGTMDAARGRADKARLLRDALDGSDASGLIGEGPDRDRVCAGLAEFMLRPFPNGRGGWVWGCGGRPTSMGGFAVSAHGAMETEAMRGAIAKASMRISEAAGACVPAACAAWAGIGTITLAIVDSQGRCRIEAGDLPWDSERRNGNPGQKAVSLMMRALGKTGETAPWEDWDAAMPLWEVGIARPGVSGVWEVCVEAPNSKSAESLAMSAWLMRHLAKARWNPQDMEPDAVRGARSARPRMAAGSRKPGEETPWSGLGIGGEWDA